MHDDPNYVRQMGPEGEEIGELGPDCGHHCGVQTAGLHTHIGHCDCKECHGIHPLKKIVEQIDARLSGLQ